MKTLTKLLFVMVVFCIGLLIGYRTTITHLQMDVVSPCRIEVTAWGQTHLYVFTEPMY